MRYFVGYLIEGEAADYYKAINEDLSRRFGIRNIALTKPLHITLKAPFESDDIELFNKQLSDLAERAPIPFIIDRFERFKASSSTISLAPVENKIFQKAADEIANAIFKFGENKLPFHIPIRLHASIVRHIDPALSKQIWEYLMALPVPYFELSFDNLTLFRYCESQWKVEFTHRFRK